MNYKELHGKSIRDGFVDFHNANPHIYEQFRRMALRAIHRGASKISAKMIVNHLRWSSVMSTGKDFKINDAYHSYYSRLFVQEYPDYIDKFEFRKLRNEEPGPYMKIGANGQIEFF